MPETPDNAEPTDESGECLTLPIEAPLTASFDAETGILRIESTVHRSAGERQLIRLQLDFAPEAAHGFVLALKAVESQLDIVVGDPVRRSHRH